METKNNKNFVRQMKKALILTLSATMVVTGLNFGAFPSVTAEAASKVIVNEDFEANAGSGFIMGDATKTVVEDAHGGEKAMMISDRTQGWNCYAIDLQEYAGKTIDLSVWMKSDDDTEGANFKATVNSGATDATQAYDTVDMKEVTP